MTGTTGHCLEIQYRNVMFTLRMIALLGTFAAACTHGDIRGSIATIPNASRQGTTIHERLSIEPNLLTPSAFRSECQVMATRYTQTKRQRVAFYSSAERRMVNGTIITATPSTQTVAYRAGARAARTADVHHTKLIPLWAGARSPQPPANSSDSGRTQSLDGTTAGVVATVLST